MANVTEIDSSGFQNLCEELSKISGKSFEVALIDRIAAVLKGCIKRTPAATREIIIKRNPAGRHYVKFASGHIVATWTKAGGAEMFLDDSTWGNRKRTGPPPKIIIKGKSWHQMDSPDRHWSDERWGRYQAMRAEAARISKQKKIDQKAALRSRGIAKHTWLQIAEDLGISAGRVGAPAYVQNARPSDGQTYKNGLAKKFLNVAAAYIEISNDSRLVVQKLDGANILRASLAAQLNAFDKDIEKGVFTDLKTRAQRYPGLFTITEN